MSIHSHHVKYVLLFTLCVGYASWFGSRDIINTASSKLISMNLFSPESYRYMVIGATISQTLFKIIAAVTVDYAQLSYIIFIVSGVFTGILTISPTILPMTQAIWITQYILVKAVCCFARVSMIDILLRYFSRQAFGRITLGIQLVAAVADAIAHIITAQLMQFHWHYMFIVQGIVTIVGVLLLILPRVYLHFNPMPHLDSRISHIKDHNHNQSNTNFNQLQEMRNGYAQLAKIPSFYILMALISLSTLIRSQTYYYVVFFAFTLGFSNEEAATIHALTPLALCIGVVLFGSILERKIASQTTKLAYYSPLLFCVLGTIASLFFTTIIHTTNVSNVMGWKIATICAMNLIQLCFSGTFVCLDGKYAIDMAPRSAVGLACNLVSSMGYVSAILVQYVIGKHAFTLAGWKLISSMNVVGCTLFTMLLGLFYHINSHRISVNKSLDNSVIEMKKQFV